MNTGENGQHRGYWSNGRRRQYNGQQRCSYMGHKTGGEKKDGSDKLQSLVKLLKEIDVNINGIFFIHLLLLLL